jgi:hypothetical protein
LPRLDETRRVYPGNGKDTLATSRERRELPVTKWIATRIAKSAYTNFQEKKLKKKKAPNSAIGAPKKRSRHFYAVEAVETSNRVDLDDFTLQSPAPLSLRAAKGFFDRITNSSLRTEPTFIRDLARHIS